MKLRTLALGSAAAVMIAGSAQAADLEPFVDDFDYVRICDAFGVGYWYAPGTDTCLRIDGHVRFQVNIFDENPIFHDFQSRAQIGLSAQSLTEFGPLFARIQMAASTAREAGNTGGSAAPFGISHAYMTIGPLLAGYTDSLFNSPHGGYGHASHRTNVSISQARLSYAVAGFGFHASVEDYFNRWRGPAGTPVGTAPAASGEMPDVVAALTGALGPIDFKVAGGVADVAGRGFVWAVRGSGELVIDPIRLRAGAAYSEDGYGFIGGPTGVGDVGVTATGTYWTAWGSARLDVAPNIYLVGSGSFTDTPAGSLWSASFSGHYTPVRNLNVSAEVTYTDETDIAGGDDSIEGLIRLQRNFP